VVKGAVTLSRGDSSSITSASKFLAFAEVAGDEPFRDLLAEIDREDELDVTRHRGELRAAGESHLGGLLGEALFAFAPVSSVPASSESCSGPSFSDGLERRRLTR
jgi:hypothetical protein